MRRGSAAWFGQAVCGGLLSDAAEPGRPPRHRRRLCAFWKVGGKRTYLHCAALSGSRNALQAVYRRAVSDSAALFADLRLRSDDDAARCLRIDRLRRGQRHADAKRSSQSVDEPGRTEGEAADAVSPRGF